MKYYLSFLLFMIAISAQAQEVSSVKFDELEKIIRNPQNNRTRVVNFWATWCKPCIEELPYFEQAHADYGTDSVEVILVSLDFDAAKAQKYQQKKGLQSTVIYLDEVDHNAWIDKISPDWSGAIPATLVITSDGREQFYEKPFKTKDELYQVINLHH